MSNNCIREKAVENQSSLYRQWEHAFFFRIKAGNLSVILVKISSLQVPHHTIQSAFFFFLQANEINTPFGGLTTVNYTVVFFQTSFLQIKFLSVTSPRFTYLGPNFFYSQQLRNVMYCMTTIIVTDTFSFIFLNIHSS